MSFPSSAHDPPPSPTPGLALGADFMAIYNRVTRATLDEPAGLMGTLPGNLAPAVGRLLQLNPTAREATR